MAFVLSLGDLEALVVTHQRETFTCLDEHGRAVLHPPDGSSIGPEERP